MNLEILKDVVCLLRENWIGGMVLAYLRLKLNFFTDRQDFCPNCEEPLLFQEEEENEKN